MQIKNKISIYFLGLIGLLFLAHAVVPHHHHYDSNSIPVHPSTEDCQHESNGSKETDYHCHAFNNLVVDNYRDQLVQIINHYPDFAIHHTEFVLFSKETEEVAYRTFNYRTINQYYYLSHHLRAPPFFS
ncbi:MAG: hypothetical protein ACQER7_08170 [Bacteroidota bacterium]